MFPTGKEHVSFSEIKEHYECPHKHWLKHVKKIDLFKPNVHTEFGTSVHAACENYILTGNMDENIAIAEIEKRWEEYKFPDIKEYINGAYRVLEEVPMFMDLTFPNWEPVMAEEFLYEKLPFVSVGGMHFKGYIDAIIKVPKKYELDQYHILDWKSCQTPWKQWKRDSELLKLQLIYYGEFYMAKKKLKRSQVSVGFATLIYGADYEGSRVELIEIEQTKQRRTKALVVLNNVIDNVSKGKHKKIYKNKWGSNCKFCDYKKTEWCDGK